MEKIKLDIGGQCFSTTLTTLTLFPDTWLGVMFSDPLKSNVFLDYDGTYFIDRDGTHFRYILNFLRSKEPYKLNLESNIKEELEREADFYGLGDRMFPFTPAKPMIWTSFPGHFFFLFKTFIVQLDTIYELITGLLILSAVS